MCRHPFIRRAVVRSIRAVPSRNCRSARKNFPSSGKFGKIIGPHAILRERGLNQPVTQPRAKSSDVPVIAVRTRLVVDRPIGNRNGLWTRRPGQKDDKSRWLPTVPGAPRQRRTPCPAGFRHRQKIPRAPTRNGIPGARRAGWFDWFARRPGGRLLFPRADNADRRNRRGLLGTDPATGHATTGNVRCMKLG